jgi:hypothetical protein
MLDVAIELGNHQTSPESSKYKPTKAKPLARTQGFFSVSVMAWGGIDQDLRMWILIEIFGELGLLE